MAISDPAASRIPPTNSVTRTRNCGGFWLTPAAGLAWWSPATAVGIRLSWTPRRSDAARRIPGGTFWLHRGEDPPLPRGRRLLARQPPLGIDAALVRIENFDEIMRDLIRLKADLDTRVLREFALERRRWARLPRRRDFAVGRWSASARFW